MTIEQLDELERLEKAATKGPWKPFSSDKDCYYDSIDDSNNASLLCVATEPTWFELANSYGGFYDVGDRDFCVAIRNAFPALLALARIGLAVQDIRPDEWEYMLKTFEAGNDRQWAIATAIRKALKGGETMSDETNDVLAKLEYALKTGLEDAPMVHKGICQSALVDTLPALRDELTRLRADNARLRKIADAAIRWKRAREEHAQAIADDAHSSAVIDRFYANETQCRKELLAALAGEEPTVSKKESVDDGDWNGKGL